MKSPSNYFILIIFGTIILNFNSCCKKPQEIPSEFIDYISQISIPVEYKEIIPCYEEERKPIPEFVTKNQALDDIQMFEYLLTTSYSGFEYWEHRGIDFKSYFAQVKDFISGKDTVYCYEFESELSQILKQIYDGHIALVGTGYNHAYRHKTVYYCDILVEKTDDGLFKVIDSKFDSVQRGDLFTQQDAEEYLFKTLSAKGKNHYLVGVFTFDIITSRKLSFNGKLIQVPFHGSRLKYAKFNDPEPFYIEWENNIPVVRVTSFADRLYPEMKKFMSSANELRNENTIIVNLFYNGGGSSVFPQGFIQNLNGTIQWETYWATLKSPAITEFYAKYDLNSGPDISPNFKNLILSHKNIYEEYRKTPVKSWEFAATHKQNRSGSYSGKLIVLTNRRVLSAGEGMVGVSRSVKNSIIIGENTGGSAQFSSTCGYYLPHSKIIAHIPRQFILIPGLEECIGYLPDYWLDTNEPVKEVLKWLDDPDNYQFRYSSSYNEMTEKIKLSPVLPEDVNVIPPGSNVPKALRAFSGRWFGVWDGVLEHILVVEKIDNNLEVNAIYSWGVAYQWDINQPGWQRYNGKFEKQTLILTDKSNKIKITYKLISESTMIATYERPGIFSRTMLTKINN
jgi:hypothetical protein